VHLSSKKKSQLIVEAALDKKADSVVILDMKKVFPICDYFVIASANSTRQAKAIAENIQEKLSKNKAKCMHVEGFREGRWVLLDYSDVVVHVFLAEIRDLYNLERLWGDAPKKVFDPGPLAT